MFVCWGVGWGGAFFLIKKKSETRMSASGLKQNPNTLKVKKNTYSRYNTCEFSPLSCCLSVAVSLDKRVIVQELCESRGGRPGLSILMSLLVSVDIKNY